MDCFVYFSVNVILKVQNLFEMDLIESEDELLPLTPPEIRDQARDVELNLLPEKSRTVYELTYRRFMEYRQKNNVGSFSETVLIAYFPDLSKQIKPSTL